MRKNAKTTRHRYQWWATKTNKLQLMRRWAWAWVGAGELCATRTVEAGDIIDRVVVVVGTGSSVVSMQGVSMQDGTGGTDDNGA